MGVLALMCLVMMLLVSLIQLVVHVEKQSVSPKNQAQANARLALVIALGELQESVGPDQRVTANARILDGNIPKSPMCHPDWLGVWSTVVDRESGRWPVIGKLPDTASDAPYEFRGIYSDLRNEMDDWTGEMRCRWLVSGGNCSPWQTVVNGIDLNGERPGGHVGTVDVGDGAGKLAWMAVDENQKASIAASVRKAHASVPSGDRWEAIAGQSWDFPFRDIVLSDDFASSRAISYESLALCGADDNEVAKLSELLDHYEGDITLVAQSLLTDPVHGGVKKDLTPLLFGRPSESVIKLGDGTSSSAPIIPGGAHATHGPRFDALRSWARAGTAASDSDPRVCVSSFISKRALRYRPGDAWPFGISDGSTFDMNQWASMFPKVLPVMTEARWHYFFSHTEGDGETVRAHIQPRVCLWNPYDVRLDLPRLLVLMPNPFWKAGYAMHFVFSETEAMRIKQMFPDPADDVQRWGSRDGRYKIRMKGAGLFPSSRYLAFVLDPVEIKPGRCLVFLPLVDAPDESVGGAAIQDYDVDAPSRNRLSAVALTERGHFVHSYNGGEYELQESVAVPPRDGIGPPDMKNRWRKFGEQVFREMRLNEVESYEPWLAYHDNHPFVLKLTGDEREEFSLNDVLDFTHASAFPTIQLMLHGTGGASTYGFWHYPWWWGDSLTASDGKIDRLRAFAEQPQRNAPRTHQFGTKLMWLDESETEGGVTTVRSRAWSGDHMAYHQAMIANWNVRPVLATRSPASPCADGWFAMTNGAWALQFAPYAPGDTRDAPVVRDGMMTKFPLSAAGSFRDVDGAVLFSVCDHELGVLSLADLQHAPIVPWSWAPSYVIGSGLADLHAPAEYSAHPETMGERMVTDGHSRWDRAIGGDGVFDYGPRADSVNSSGLLQVPAGSNETLAYDICYEVNQNLWDQFFLSGLPMMDDGRCFDQPYVSSNPRYDLYDGAVVGAPSYLDRLGDSETGLVTGYHLNGSQLRVRAGFNVNSTSVPAWSAFLAGARGKDVAVRTVGATFHRLVRLSQGIVDVDDGVDSNSRWSGSRLLSDIEIDALANEIVAEVKARGPFLSMADFVNRRLVSADDASSRCGALDAAIERAGLNDWAIIDSFATSFQNNGDHNAPEWQVDPSRQPQSKIWGAPGYLIQGDLLRSLAPAMTVRGDTFKIRCYGESGHATAWLEAVVRREVAYVDSSDGGNRPEDAALILDRQSAQLTDGGLTTLNQRFGRRFVVESVRWFDGVPGE